MNVSGLVSGELIVIHLDGDQDKPKFQFIWNMKCWCGKQFQCLSKPRQDRRHWCSKSCRDKASGRKHKRPNVMEK